MSDPSAEDYVNILTQLYSRKATKKAFTMIRKDFQEQTGKELCDVIRSAQQKIIQDITKLPPEKIGTKTRTEVFKLIDYSTWLRFCPVKRGKVT